MNSVFHNFYKKLSSSFKFIYSLNTKVHEDNTIHVQWYNVHINQVKGTEVHNYVHTWSGCNIYWRLIENSKVMG